MDKPVIIFGAKGIAVAALEIFQRNRIVVYGFLEDDAALHGSAIEEITVLGAMEDHGFLKLIGKKCESFVAVENVKERKQVVKMLTELRKVMPTNAIHPDTTIATNAHIGHGNFIDAGVGIGAQARVSEHIIVQTGAIIERGVELGAYVQIGPGAVIGAEVRVGAGTFIGAGAVLVGGLEVGKGARIGAGSVVIEPVKAGETIFGNPAQKVK